MKYKKILIFLSFLVLVGGQTVLSAIPENSDISDIAPRDKTENNTLSIDEFNKILGTLRGIFNWERKGKTQIGIGDSTPDKDLTLDVEGKIGAQFFCDENGDNCIRAGEWSTSKNTTPTTSSPSIKTKNLSAQCKLRYRVKVGSRIADWVETGGNNAPEGPWSTFTNTQKIVCADRGCAIQLGIKCEKSQNNPNPTSCQARYRLFDKNNTAIDRGWITTPKSEEASWKDGEWLEFKDWNNLSWQIGMQCQSEESACRISYKTRDEKNITNWSTSPLTQDNIWSDGVPQMLQSDRTRPCDGINGCGIKLRLHCTERSAVPKIPIYQCPQEKFGKCDTTCQGQLSADATCTMTKNDDEGICAKEELKICTPLGHLVR